MLNVLQTCSMHPSQVDSYMKNKSFYNLGDKTKCKIFYKPISSQQSHFYKTTSKILRIRKQFDWSLIPL